MAEKQTNTQLEPPFSPRPIPPDDLKSQSSSSASTPKSTHQNGGIQTSALLDKAAEMPLTAMQSLPTIIEKKIDERTPKERKSIELVKDNIGAFIKLDLDLDRLNVIHKQLWMAGRPLRARPLHRYRMMHFDVLHTQQLDLHLLKFSNCILIKPLPEYMLDHSFWTEWICTNEELHKAGCGFLLSYLWLITSPLDLKLAHESYLLPSYITWKWWKNFVEDFYTHIDVNALDQVNRRFHFGDLRLGRINTIYRIRKFHTHFVRGYLYGYNRYVVYFERNFSWMLVLFAFFSLVLSAMQVGAGIEPLQGNRAFQRASYGFVVFSMVTVGAVLAFVGAIFAGVFVFNMIAAITHDKTARRDREKRAEARKQAQTV